MGTSNKSVFSYDGLGHRVVDAETLSGTTTTTRYLWCGGTICQTRDGSDTVLRRELPEGEYNVSSGQKLVYMPDQLGSVRDVIDAATGSLVQSYDYTPYGALARSNGSTPADYRFAGLFYHQNSGLNFSATRVQDGVTGRWLNRDPIREAGGIDLYVYAAATPSNKIDPQGLCPKSCGLKKAPEYDIQGTVKGPTPFSWSAEFLNDAIHDPKCCEVRQSISWNMAQPPHEGFKRPEDKPNQWYEDRAPNGQRYGRRTGPYVAPSNPESSYNTYGQNDYKSWDEPYGFGRGDILSFRLSVVDVCNGENTIFTSKILNVRF